MQIKDWQKMVHLSTPSERFTQLQSCSQHFQTKLCGLNALEISGFKICSTSWCLPWGYSQSNEVSSDKCWIQSLISLQNTWPDLSNLTWPDLKLRLQKMFAFECLNDIHVCMQKYACTWVNLNVYGYLYITFYNGLGAVSLFINLCINRFILIPMCGDRCICSGMHICMNGGGKCHHLGGY